MLIFTTEMPTHAMIISFSSMAASPVGDPGIGSSLLAQALISNGEVGSCKEFRRSEFWAMLLGSEVVWGSDNDEQFQ